MKRGLPPLFQRSSVGLTDRGGVRELNEDHLLTDDRRGLWAVADGMGGYARGDVASQLVIESLNHVRTTWSTPKSLALDVLSRLEEANQDLLNEAATSGAGMMGSTVACLAVFDDHALAAWCGDSRIYRLRSGAHIQRISRDHSMVQEMVDAGQLTEDEAEAHPEAHVLTRGLGVEGRFGPEFRQMTIQSGDRFVLCSDGLSRCVPDTGINAISGAAANPQVSSSRLMEAALDQGAPDNVTVVTVDFM